MRMLHECPRIMSLLARYNIVGLVHTGHDGPDTLLDGFTCVRALTRPVDPASGGVALFVKSGLALKVVVVRERAELGMLWIKFEGVSIASVPAAPSFVDVQAQWPGQGCTLACSHH